MAQLEGGVYVGGIRVLEDRDHVGAVACVGHVEVTASCLDLDRRVCGATCVPGQNKAAECISIVFDVCVCTL